MRTGELCGASFSLHLKPHDLAASVITTNLAFKRWGTVFPGAACVAALVDRFVQQCQDALIRPESRRRGEAPPWATPRTCGVSERRSGSLYRGTNYDEGPLLCLGPPSRYAAREMGDMGTILTGRIRYWSKRHGIKLTLTKREGRSRTYFFEVVAGRKLPSLAWLESLADDLGVEGDAGVGSVGSRWNWGQPGADRY